MAPNKKDAPKLPAGLMFGDTVKLRDDETIYHDVIPLGSTGIAAGVSGTGKSTLLCHIAAELSNEGIVSILSLREDQNHKSVARLMASGADMAKILLARDRGWKFPRDLDELEATIQAIDAKLVVLDTADKHFSKGEASQEAQTILEALDFMAARHNCAIILICHTLRGISRNSHPISVFPKKLIGTARLGLLFGKCADQPNPDVPKQRAMVVAKASHGPDGRVVVYDFDTEDVEADGVQQTAPVLTVNDAEFDVADWEAYAMELVLGKAGSRGPDKSVSADAADWLTDLLAAGPAPVASYDDPQHGTIEGIKELAKAEGFSWSSVTRAKKDAGIEAKKGGYQGKWFWQLPDGHPKLQTP